MSTVLPQLGRSSLSSPVSIDGANQGSLLLWLEGGVVYSINRMATIIWEMLEDNPKGLQLSQIVDDIGKQCQLPTDSPFAEMVKRDVRELLEWFEHRGVLQKKGLPVSEATYRILGTVFRAENQPSNANPLCDADTSSSSSEQEIVRAVKLILTPAGTDRKLGVSALDQIAEINKHHSPVHTGIAFLLFTAYDLSIKVLGFRRLFQIVAQWQLRKCESPNTALIQRVCAGIERARIWYPKQIMCMQHSVVSKCLLQHYGVPARMSIAARKMPFKSHAWVEVDGRVVNDTQKVLTYYNVFRRY